MYKNLTNRLLKTFVAFIAALFLAPHWSYAALSPEVSKGVTWLQSQVTADGGLSNESNSVAKLAATKSKLDTSQYAGLTKEDISGDLLYSSILAYFAANQTAARVSAQAAQVVDYRKPSFGSFMATAQTSYWFGLPRNVSFPGFTMDVDWYMTMAATKDNAPTKSYMQQSGMRLSAYEHLIPEKLFTDKNDPNRAQGVSAVKALAVASAQGQKIYTITSANMAAVLPQLTISNDIKAEIQNAINAGKTATVSQGNITLSGWSGVGYIISDPATGAGAYKISGGANGGNLSNAILGLVGLASLILFVNKLALIGVIGAFVSPYILLAVGLLIFLGAILAVTTDTNIEYKGEVATQIEAFVTMAVIASIALIGGFGIIAIAVYVSMLLMIARLAYLTYI